MLLVSHDLRLIAHAAGRVAVMAMGQIVETGDTEQVLARPSHPVTREMVDALGRAEVWRHAARR